jgi:hypothetical protein
MGPPSFSYKSVCVLSSTRLLPSMPLPAARLLAAALSLAAVCPAMPFAPSPGPYRGSPSRGPHGIARAAPAAAFRRASRSPPARPAHVMLAGDVSAEAARVFAASLCGVFRQVQPRRPPFHDSCAIPSDPIVLCDSNAQQAQVDANFQPVITAYRCLGREVVPCGHLDSQFHPHSPSSALPSPPPV